MTDPQATPHRPSRLVSGLRAPALHFAVAGALVFVVARAVEPSAAPGPPPEWREITIDAVRIQGLKRDYELANRVVATPAEVQALVDKAVTEEILFREGLARGFEHSDRAIKWRVVQKMRYLGEDHGEDADTLYERGLALGLHLSDPVVQRILTEKVRLLVGRASSPPTDEELEQWFSSHTAEYTQSERVTLRHVFFDRGRRGDEGAHQAAVAAAIQAEGHDVSIAGALGGDPFVMGAELAAQAKGDLTKFFGPDFAGEVLSMPAGRWSAPVESTYGWHVVFVERRLAPRVPELSEVRSRVLKSLEASRRKERVAAFLERVRPGYVVQIDEDAIREDGRG